MAHVTSDRTKPFGAMTADLVTAINTARANANRIKAAADAIGAGADPTVLEVGHQGDGAANFGVPAGQGAAFYTALGWLHDGLANIASDQLSNLDLGA